MHDTPSPSRRRRGGGPVPVRALLGGAVPVRALLGGAVPVRALLGGAVAACLAALSLSATPAVAATPRPPTVPLPADTGHTPHATRIQATAKSATVSLAIALNPRDPAALDRFDAQVSDPHSPRYRHFLTARQYTDTFAPTAAQLAKVESFLRAQGLKVTGVAGNRQVIDATGSAAKVASAFHTGFSDYRGADGRLYRAADRPASAPADVAALISSVAGLTNRPIAVHAPLPHPRRATPAGSGPSGGESPADLQKAYSMGSVVSAENGSGHTVGLVQFDGFHQSDIDAFTQQYSLPSINPTVVPIDGGVSSPGSGQIEVTLDIDSTAVYAPNAAQMIYEGPNTDQAWTDEWAKIASDDKVDVLSTSWLNGEACSGSGVISSTHNSISQMVSQGITVLSASGDWGAHGCGFNGDESTLTTDYPASDPNVTGVGGTHLQTASDGSYQSESVWNTGSSGSTRSGGGYSSTYDTPSWQTSVNSNAHRSVPDVSLAADPNAGGLSINLNGSWETVGGTSEASPLWAGYTADAVQKAGKRLGSLNPTIYQIAESSAYSTDFHDTTQGSNGTYSAGTGYDLATGWGTPIGDQLISGLTGGSPPPPANDFSIALSPTSATVTAGQSTSTTVSTKVTSGSAENISLSASGLPTGATASFSPTTVNGNGTSTLTVSTSASTPAGTYNVSVTGKDTDATHSASFALTVQGHSGGNDITNGGFETGDLSGWTPSGSVSVVTSPVHSGKYAASVGAGNGTLSQSFTAHGPTLSLYYALACSGSNPFGFTTITLTDQATNAQQNLVSTFCIQTASGFRQASSPLTTGHTYTLTINNQDYSFTGGKAATVVDDVSDAS